MKGKFALIMHKKWKVRSYGTVTTYCEGWFLLGFIPLWITAVEA